MAECAFCKTNTNLYDSGASICIACADRRESNRRALETDKRVRVTLIQDLIDAHARTEAFSADGRNASSARKEMMKAHSRLNDFLNGGIVPEDLKRSG